MISTGIYPVIWTAEYKSGAIKSGVCDKGWPALLSDLKRLQELGVVSGFRFSTKVDRLNKGQTVNRFGRVVKLPRASTFKPPKFKRRFSRR